MRVLVVGAGISGLTVAHELHRLGHDVTVMERQEQLGSEGYMIDFSGPGYDAAQRMGLLSRLAEIHYPIGQLMFVDGDCKVRADLPYPRLRKEIFHDRHFNFMRGDLERVLFRSIESSVPVRFGTSPATLDPAGTTVRIKTSHGASESFDLVVAADGFRSRVRNLAFLAGETMPVYFGCHTAAYVAERPIAGLEADALVSMSAPGLSAAAYPIRGGRTATFFVHRATSRLVDRSPEACRLELEATYRGQGWVLDELLDAFPGDGNVYFDDVAQLEAKRWSVGRVVLVGDAAGCVSLLAGQGASLAMYGAYVLAQELAREPGDIPGALERYEVRVRPIVSERQRAASRNLSWFLPRTRVGTMLRDRITRTAMTPPIAWMLGRHISGARAPFD
jgi:2-polyprenyl-6-methoxyphenol hydroxylase-like FAD-dependent oxidoreductase